MFTGNMILDLFFNLRRRRTTMNRTPAQKITLYSLRTEMESEETISDIQASPTNESQAAREVLLSRTVAQMPALLWTTDLNLNLSQISGNELERTSRSAEHAVGMSLGAYFDIETLQSPLLAAHFSALGGHAQSFEFVLGDALFWGIAEPLFDSEWNLIGTIGVALDITVRKQEEEESLRRVAHDHQAEKQRSMQRLAGGIAHHFNNLLAVILGNTSLLLNDMTATHPWKDRLTDIEKASQLAANLVNELILYGEREKRKAEPVHLSRLIEGQYSSFRNLLPQKITLKCDLEDDLPHIEGDPEQFNQLLLTLLFNASEAIGDTQGAIILRTQVVHTPPLVLPDGSLGLELPEGDYVWLQVSDTGQGLDDETKARIFEPFQSGPFSRPGLGLATALGIVRGHHGTISVSSKPGLGTTCHVLLPVLSTDFQVGATPESGVPVCNG